MEGFSHWKIEALRSFLSQELVAIAFAANTLNMPIIPTAVEIEKSKLECYKNLLKVGDVILPDPFLIFDKWEDETQGMSHWPPVFIRYYRCDHFSNEIRKRGEGSAAFEPI